MSPQRIQLRRTKGWRKPEGAIVVARPSRWGNPYSVHRTPWTGYHEIQAVGELVAQFHTRDEALDVAINLYRGLMYGWDPAALPDYANFEVAYAAALNWQDRHEWCSPIDEARVHLAGRDLACWCPLDQPCHADVLLELANPRVENDPPI